MDQENNRFEYNPNVAYPEIGQNPAPPVGMPMGYAPPAGQPMGYANPAGQPMGPGPQNINNSPYGSNEVNRGVVIGQVPNSNQNANYDFIRAEQQKNNWTTVIKVISWILLILGIIFLILSILSFIGDLADMDDDYSDDVHYDYNYASVDPEFTGGIGAFLAVFDMIWDVLIIVQGYYGIRTAKKNTPEAISKLIRVSIWLTLAHLALTGIKTFIASLILREISQEWGEIMVDDDDSITSEDLTNILFGILFVSLTFACLCTCCC